MTDDEPVDHLDAPVSGRRLRTTSRRSRVAFLIVLAVAIVIVGYGREQQQANTRNIRRLARDEAEIKVEQQMSCVRQIHGWQLRRDIIIGATPVVKVSAAIANQFPADVRSTVVQAIQAGLDVENRALIANRHKLLAENGPKPSCDPG